MKKIGLQKVESVTVTELVEWEEVLEWIKLTIKATL